MSEQRESYQTIYREYLAELETTRTELLEAIDRLESQRRAEAQRYNRLKEAAWSVCSTADHPLDRVTALRALANLIDFPGWSSL